MNFIVRLATLIVAVASLYLPAFAGGVPVPLAAKGCEQLNRGNFSSAICYLTAAVRQNPADLEARRKLSSAYIGAGMAKEAIQQLEAIAKVVPAGAKDYAMIAEAYFQVGDTKTAIARYRQATQADPQMASAKIGLARTLMSCGDSCGAAAVCNDALRTAQDSQSRQQFVALLSTIRMHAGIAHRQLNG